MVIVNSDKLPQLIDYVQNCQEIIQIKINEAFDASFFFSNENLRSINFHSNNSDDSIENWWLKAVNATNLSFSGKNINIAILDTGISVHPDFFVDGDPDKSRIIKSQNFTSEYGISQEIYTYDSYGHGTHCAGIAAGNGYLSNGKFRGVAPNANLINAKISNSSGFIEEADTIAAIDWCVSNNADVLSMSFGDIVPEVWNLEALAIKKAVEAGVVVVASAGNSGPNLYTSGSPSSGLYTISVGVTDKDNNLVDFSSRGPSYTNQLLPDLCAPGVDIISVESEGSLLSIQDEYLNSYIEGLNDFDYIWLSGTSMSCPLVAGAIALLLEAYPDANPEIIRMALFLGAKKIINEKFSGYGDGQGAGLLDVATSLEILSDLLEETSNINNNAKLFPREIPYSPFDLFKFPGDSQQLNLTLFSGYEVDIRIEIEEIPGILIEIDKRTVSFERNGLISFPVFLEIYQNCTIGNKYTTLFLLEETTNRILDEISIEIKVCTPKSNIYIDSFHCMSDSQNFSHYSFSQYEMYHFISDLYENNYSVDFFMDGLTPDYNSFEDAEILNLQLLSKYDTVILQSPILPYLDLEIEALKNFHSNGGNIVFLGTIQEHLELVSVEKLFDELNSSIRIGQNIFNYTDYAQYAKLNPKILRNINNQSILFQNVSKLEYSLGCSFSGDSNTVDHAILEDKSIIIEEKNKTISQGIILGIADYNIFLDESYNSKQFFYDHGNFSQNCFDYLTNHTNKLNSRKLIINQNSRELNSSKIGINFYIFDLENNLVIDEPEIIDNLEIQVKNPQNLQANYDYTKIDNSGYIHLTIDMKETHDCHPFIIDLSTELDGVTYSRRQYFYHTSSNSNIYYSIELNESEILRNSIESYELQFNGMIGDEINYLFTSTLFNPSFLSKTNISMIDMNKWDYISFDVNSTYKTVIFNSSFFDNGGELIVIATRNNSHSSNIPIDLTPYRNSFQVQKNYPQINYSSSFLGDTYFSETFTDDGIFPIDVQPDNYYDLFVDVYNEIDSPEKVSSYIVTAAIFPILTYNGFIHILSPRSIPREDLEFDSILNGFFVKAYIPSNFSYSTKNGTIIKDLGSNQDNFYSLIWISVRNNEGVRNEFQIILSISEEPPNFFNLVPILLLISLLAVSILFFNYYSKQKKKKELTLINNK